MPTFSSSSCEPQSRCKSSVHTSPPSKRSSLKPELTYAGKSPANVPLCCSSFHFELLPHLITFLPRNLHSVTPAESTQTFLILSVFSFDPSSQVVRERLTFSERWEEETAVALSVNGPCRDPPPAVGPPVFVHMGKNLSGVRSGGTSMAVTAGEGWEGWWVSDRSTCQSPDEHLTAGWHWTRSLKVFTRVF